MGGRGASSGVSDKGKTYGSEYKTVLKSGNIKFVVPKDGSTTAPMETMTKRRVYVTVNKDKNIPAMITYYDNQNKRYKQIDLTHEHKSMKPHTHNGYFHNENDSKKGAANLTVKERKMVDRINQLWYNHK